MVMSIEDEAHQYLPFCNVCLGSTDTQYQASKNDDANLKHTSSGGAPFQTYNIAISGILLAVVGLVGMVGNCFVILVYTRREQRVHSTSVYLAALAVSDLSMTCTAMFLFVLEAWRHHGPPGLARTYALGAPVIFPLGAIFQTTSVYFCVAAAVDCFISVVLPRAISEICCNAKKARVVVYTLTVLCLVYNVPHFFEIHAIECIDAKHGGIRSLQICPTDIRLDALYYTVYYTYMYTTFMAVGPLLLLIVLNCFVVACVIKQGASEDSDTMSLILVVCFFIFCNFTALLVNFIEQALYEQLKHVIVYLVDLSNLLVVINCTANFFVYLIFGNSFRRTFFSLFGAKNAKPGAGSVDAELLENEEANALDGTASASSAHQCRPILKRDSGNNNGGVWTAETNIDSVLGVFPTAVAPGAIATPNESTPAGGGDRPVEAEKNCSGESIERKRQHITVVNI